MKKTVLCLAFIGVSTAIVYEAEGSSLCGDDTWIAFGDEKCFKLFPTFATRNQADEVCSQQAGIISVPTLVTIRSAAEQKFLVEYISNTSDSNNVWIGAVRRPGSESEFVWNDGSAVQQYTNWGIGRPSDDVRRSCVQMQSDVARGLSDMKWTDIACTIGNWFVCQKFQTCSCENFQQALLATRRDLQHSVEIFTRQMTDVKNQLDELRNNQPDFPDEQLAEMRNQIRELQDNQLIRDKQIADMSNQLRDLRNNQSDWHNITSQLKYLQNNPVPIGFIYVQLRNQSEPGTLWVNTTWQEITSQYAGLFFRAVGEGSAAFGVTQLENSPRLTDVGTARLPGFVNQIPIQPTGSWSLSLPVGEPNPSASVHFGLSFVVRSGEVRPRNTAMRIWIRTG